MYAAVLRILPDALEIEEGLQSTQLSGKYELRYGEVWERSRILPQGGHLADELAGPSVRYLQMAAPRLVSCICARKQYVYCLTK